ncbi:hypothetical protein GCM10007362_33830 [Saccharibacillus endophyticus]|uniref:Uncharacterized protein n=1 Tax=Saccharibacillus endophyticus TaxID=2060666 RepID=A0ABQ2A1N9_9BACL|nr:hypothetical protein GCM10007362_33830 [Saccharibacillus endophyticus]
MFVVQESRAPVLRHNSPASSHFPPRNANQSKGWDAKSGIYGERPLVKIVRPPRMAGSFVAVFLCLAEFELEYGFRFMAYF